MIHPQIPLTLWLEKIPQKGEDASPTVEYLPDGSGLVAVFDGLGGSGATQYEWEDSTFTGAWIGSRLSKILFSSSLTWAKKREEFSVEFWLDEYTIAVKEILNTVWKKLDKNPSKLRSSLIRPLPTTLAAIYFESEGNGFRAWCINSGDSRSYILNPERGLQQVSQDDIVTPGDALETLHSSTRISDCLAADGKFNIHVYPFETNTPVVFLSASDGCFDYVPFPANFEFILLDCLQLADSQGNWAIRLGSKFRSIAGDDVSLALSAMGWKDFNSLKEAFRERHAYLLKNFAAPIEKMEEKIRQAPEDDPDTQSQKIDLRNRLWADYRVNYESFMKIPEQQKK